MNVLSLDEMIACEQHAFAAGITADALMEAAGQSMAALIRNIYPRASCFLVLVGKGNNGGDGLVVARELGRAGLKVKVALTAPEDQLGRLPLAHLDRLRKEVAEVEVAGWRYDLEYPGSTGVVVDALLGIQAKGPLRENLHDVVATTNAAREQRFFRTVALDLPTGLAAFEKDAKPQDRDDAIVADVTLTVGFAKEVLTRESHSAWVGRLEVIPWSQHPSHSMPRQFLLAHELAQLLPRRSASSFKGTFGKLAIVAGGRGFAGAAILCTQAAQAMGAGLLSVVTHAEAAPIIAANSPPEAMISSWDNLAQTPEVVTQATAIAIGPGLGIGDATLEMLRGALAVGCPVLIDADGLNVLARKMDLLPRAKGSIILTPHVGEMARLLKRKIPRDEHEAAARECVDRHNVTLVLKGTRTLITAPGKQFYINGTGNPGLSTGGSGDTLSGIIGALLVQGLGPMDAARLGVWLHGHVADLVLAERGCEEGLTPTMLSAHLGKAIVSLRAQSTAPRGLIERAR